MKDENFNEPIAILQPMTLNLQRDSNTFYRYQKLADKTVLNRHFLDNHLQVCPLFSMCNYLNGAANQLEKSALKS